MVLTALKLYDIFTSALLKVLPIQKNPKNVFKKKKI